jgi:hypothetical protein
MFKLLPSLFISKNGLEARGLRFNTDLSFYSLRGSTATKEYLWVRVGYFKKQIHRLVAMAFLGYDENTDSVIDHIDNNSLNNHVDNLQITTTRYNSSKDRKNKSSKYTGVCWYKPSKKWMSQIYINGKVKNLGYYISEEEAYQAYQNALNEIQ